MGVEISWFLSFEGPDGTFLPWDDTVSLGDLGYSTAWVNVAATRPLEPDEALHAHANLVVPSDIELFYLKDGWYGPVSTGASNERVGRPERNYDVRFHSWEGLWLPGATRLLQYLLIVPSSHLGGFSLLFVIVAPKLGETRSIREVRL